MSAPLRSGSVLHCISVTLSHVLAQDSQVVIAEIIGVSPSTISRRGDDLNQWPFPDLMRLSLHRHELLEAICRVAKNLPDLGDPNRVRSDLLIEIEESGNITNKIAKAMADGRISRREAASIRQAIQHRRNKEDDFILRSLAAIEEGEVYP